MAIQQVTSGGGSGILSFLFHDDGVTGGLALEDAGFASTLHQLLGEHGATQAGTGIAAAGFSTALSDAELQPDPTSAAAPGSALEALASDFALPAHGAPLPSQAELEVAGEAQEHEQPFWGLAPFTDVAAALREHHVESPHADATAPLTNPTRTEVAHAPPAPAFGKGIRNLIELARDAEQLAGQLSPGAPLPAPVAVQASGTTAPAGGKTLPQAYRPSTVAMNLATGSSQSRGTRAANSEALPLAAADVAFDTAPGSAWPVDAISSDVRGAHSPSAAALSPVIQGLRGESTLPNPSRGAAAADSAQAAPLFDSPHVAGTEAWFEDLGARVEWLNDMNIDRAEMQLHPAELGLLEINISTGDDGAAVSFVTHNSEARELIEASMPKLRELLQAQGLQLGQSEVSQQSEGQRRGQDAPADGPTTQPDRAADETAPQRRTVYVRDPHRIDHYV